MKIAIVGLGVAGLSICARLAVSGHDVSGFEQFELMHDQGSSHGDTRIMRLTPGEGEIYVRMARRAQPLWRAWEGLAGQPLIEWTGGLMAGPTGSAFVRNCQLMSAKPAGLLRGDVISVMTRGAMAMPYEWDVFRQEDCGVIGADATRAFLIRQAGRWGAKLRPRVKIEAPITSTSLRVNGETLNFDAVIVAAGGWARTLLPEFAARLVVKRRVVGWFATQTPRMLPVICVDNDVGLFGMPAPRGLYKLGLHRIGDTVDPDDVRAPDDKDSAMLSAQAHELLPLHDLKPVRMARCLYTVTADENFLIAPSQAHDRVLLFSPCSGHGFKFAPLYGEMAEAWVDGKMTPELEAFGVSKRVDPALGLGG